MVKKTRQQLEMNVWWVRALIAVAFVGLAYGFASLAIDSGSLLQYAIGIGFLWFGIKHAIKAIRLAF